MILEVRQNISIDAEENYFYICIHNGDFHIYKWLIKDGTELDFIQYVRNQEYYEKMFRFNSKRFAIQVIKRIYPLAKRMYVVDSSVIDSNLICRFEV